MKQSTPISDELLSAYIDRQISEAELQRVEMALAAEPALQQRLDALQATVQFLQQTPSLVVPRAFVLSENQVLAAGGRVRGAKQPSFWEQWLPRLMPAATALIAVLFVFSFVMPLQNQGEIVAEPVTMETAPPPAAEAMAADEGAPAAENATAEKSGPTALSAEPRSAVPEQAVGAESTNESAGEASLMATGANEPAAAAEKEAPPAESATSTETTTTPEPAPPSPRISWLTWLLGLLLILFIFLTWRLTLGRPRGE